MKSKTERTLFFVKPDCESPHIDKATALEIIAFLEAELKTDFKRLAAIRTQAVPEKFYREFYTHLKKTYPDILDAMATEFKGKSLAVFVYEGPDIIQRIEDIAGPTLYEDNIGLETIREKFGNNEMGYRTVVHASDITGVKRDFKIMKKYKLIPDNI